MKQKDHVPFTYTRLPRAFHDGSKTASVLSAYFTSRAGAHLILITSLGERY